MSELPTGPRQTRWYQAGYQAALADILREAKYGGGCESVITWLEAANGPVTFMRGQTSDQRDDN
jgi:hypothetical protein